jgi:phosphoglycolate phosphatase-like HAD superfamily hydrolase
MKDQQATDGENNVLVFDFDRTLFDVKLLITKFREGFASCGVSAAIFDETLAEVDKDKMYSPRKHVMLVCKKCPGVKEDALIVEYEKVFSIADQILFDGAKELVDRLSGKYHIILMTFGNIEYQIDKVHGSGIAAPFEEVIFTLDRTKVSPLRGIIARFDNVCLIDDRISTLKSVKEALPQVRTVWMRRPGDKYAEGNALDGADLTFGNFKEFEEAIPDIFHSEGKLCKQ